MRLGELTSRFQARVAQDREVMEKTVSIELNVLRQSLSESSSDVLNITKDGIRRHGELLSQMIWSQLDLVEQEMSSWRKVLAGGLLKSFFWGMGLALGLGIAGLCVLALLNTRLERIQSVTAQWETHLEELRNDANRIEKNTWGLKLVEDRQGRFIVLPEGTTAVTGWTVGDRHALRLE